MNKREFERRHRLYSTLESHGFTVDEIDSLRRISNALSRWSEGECNGEIERDETTGQTYRIIFPGMPNERRSPCRDKESSSLRRLASILQNHGEWTYYHQGDPRGCALYLINKAKLQEYADCGTSLDCCYSSVGIAVY